MRITHAEDYALRAVLYLAGQPVGAYCALETIARRQEIPLPFLRKLVKPLQRAGLVVSRRGADGGIALARPAHGISFKDVLEAVGGPIVLQGCVSPLPERAESCGIASRCQMQETWRRLQAQLVESLEAIHVGDLVAPPIALKPRAADRPGRAEGAGEAAASRGRSGQRAGDAA